MFRASARAGADQAKAPATVRPMKILLITLSLKGVMFQRLVRTAALPNRRRRTTDAAVSHSLRGKIYLRKRWDVGRYRPSIGPGTVAPGARVPSPGLPLGRVPPPGGSYSSRQPCAI